MKRIISTLLLISIAFTLSSCHSSSRNLTEEHRDDRNKSPLIYEYDEEKAQNAEDALRTFGAELFKKVYEADKNTLVSPVSVSFALAMTAGGSGGDTFSEFEALLGRGVSMSDMNDFYKQFSRRLDESEKNDVNVANSVWIRDSKDRLSVKESFLEFCDDYFDADVYLSPFDKSTVRDMNNWVKDETDGMIKEIVDDIDFETVMFLVNALSFDAEWKNEYNNTNEYFSFYDKDGNASQVTGLLSTEQKYIEDENTVGFIKPYYGNEYSFALLLPKYGTDIDSYVTSLTGEKIKSLLENAQSTQVSTIMPKFTFEYRASLKEILQELMLTHAFDSQKADLSGIGISKRGNLFVSDVIHKTFIEVAEKGTRAAAVTVVEVKDEAMALPIDKKEVIANRPFVFMIIDNATNVPLFIGTVLNPK